MKFGSLRSLEVHLFENKRDTDLNGCIIVLLRGYSLGCATGLLSNGVGCDVCLTFIGFIILKYVPESVFLIKKYLLLESLLRVYY